jgi:hypothetical protein
MFSGRNHEEREDREGHEDKSVLHSSGALSRVPNGDDAMKIAGLTREMLEGV